MNTKQRWFAIAALGLATLILAELAPAPEENVVAKTSNNKRPINTVKSPTQDSAEVNLSVLRPRKGLPLENADLFQSQSWYVPPPPPPKPKPQPPPPPPPPPVPQAPPMPYSAMGGYHEPGGKLVVYLTRGDKLYTVSVGDTLDGIYKIESIKSGQLAMLYLPLNIRQNLHIGDF